MSTVRLALGVAAALVDRHRGLPEPLARGLSSFMVDEVMPLVGSAALCELGETDIEALLVTLEQEGASTEHRLLAHYSLIFAFDLGVAFGWTDRNPAVSARPV